MYARRRSAAEPSDGVRDDPVAEHNGTGEPNDRDAEETRCKGVQCVGSGEREGVLGNGVPDGESHGAAEYGLCVADTGAT